MGALLSALWCSSMLACGIAPKAKRPATPTEVPVAVEEPEAEAPPRPLAAVEVTAKVYRSRFRPYFLLKLTLPRIDSLPATPSTRRAYELALTTAKVLDQAGEKVSDARHHRYECDLGDEEGNPTNSCDEAEVSRRDQALEAAERDAERAVQKQDALIAAALLDVTREVQQAASPAAKHRSAEGWLHAARAHLLLLQSFLQRSGFQADDDELVPQVRAQLLDGVEHSGWTVPAGAAAALTQATKLVDPAEAGAAELYTCAAEVQWLQGNRRAATRTLARLTRVGDAATSYDVQLRLGLLLAQEGAFDQAQRALTRALGSKPRSSHRGLADAAAFTAWKSGDAVGAARVLLGPPPAKPKPAQPSAAPSPALMRKMAIAILPSPPSELLIDAVERAGLRNVGLEDYPKAKRASILGALAWRALDRHQLDQARRLAQQALDLAPKSAESRKAHQVLRSLALHEGDDAEAEALKQRLEKLPASLAALVSLVSLSDTEERTREASLEKGELEQSLAHNVERLVQVCTLTETGSLSDGAGSLELKIVNFGQGRFNVVAEFSPKASPETEPCLRKLAPRFLAGIDSSVDASVSLELHRGKPRRGLMGSVLGSAVEGGMKGPGGFGMGATHGAGAAGGGSVGGLGIGRIGGGGIIQRPKPKKSP